MPRRSTWTPPQGGLYRYNRNKDAIMRFDSDAKLFDTPPAVGEKRRFAAGQEVPKWLLDLEPFHPGSKPAAITFSMPTDVLDFGDRYVMLPLFMGSTPYGAILTEAQGCNIFAPTKEVRVVTAAAVVHMDPTATVSPVSMELYTQLSPRPAPSPEPSHKVDDLGVDGRPILRQVPNWGLVVFHGLLGASVGAAFVALVFGLSRIFAHHPLF